MKRLSNILVASLEDAGVISTTVDERTEAQIDIEAERDAIEQIDVIAEQADMIESLEALATMARNLVKSGTASMESAELLNSAVSQVLGNEAVVDENCLGFESGADVNVYHDHVAASLEGLAAKVGQNLAMTLASMGSYYKQLWGSWKAKTGSINHRLNELDRWFKERKDLQVEEAKLRAISYTGFMHANGKPVSSLSSAVSSDSKTVMKVLNDVLGDYRAAIEKVINNLKSAKSDDALIASMKTIKHPLNGLDSSITSKDSLLRGRYFELKPGKAMSSYEFGDINQRHRLVIRHSKFKDTVGQFASLKDAVVGKNQSVNEATSAISDLRSYVAALEKSVNGANRYTGLVDKLVDATKAAKENGISNDLINAVSRVANDLAAAIVATDKTTWTHGFSVCRDGAFFISRIAAVTNTGEKNVFEDTLPTVSE